MRLLEFADSSPYTGSTDDATNLIEQLGRIWSRDELHRRLNMVHSSLPRVCHHLSGTYRCIRHRAV